MTSARLKDIDDDTKLQQFSLMTVQLTGPSSQPNRFLQGFSFATFSMVAGAGLC